MGLRPMFSVARRVPAGIACLELESLRVYSDLSLSPLTKTPRLFAVIAAVVAIGALMFAGGARAADPSDASYLVTFSSGTSSAEQQAAISAAGATDVSAVSALRLHSITAS